jgi:hypothetical protein
MIHAVASGGVRDRQFLAVFTSNDHLILRSSSRDHPPYVRLVPWFKDQMKKIVAMEFSPSCEWLLTVTADATLNLVPCTAFLQVDTGA